MSKDTFNKYRIMWLFVMFDLPVETKMQRKAATRFRNNLLKLGFSMVQYSVYIRHCPSLESAQSYIRKVEKILEDYGEVYILMITDKQYGDMQVYFQGQKGLNVPKPSQQLEIF